LENSTKNQLGFALAANHSFQNLVKIISGASRSGCPFNQGVSDVNVFDYRDSGLETSTDGDMIYQALVPKLSQRFTRPDRHIWWEER